MILRYLFCIPLFFITIANYAEIPAIKKTSVSIANAKKLGKEALQKGDFNSVQEIIQQLRSIQEDRVAHELESELFNAKNKLQIVPEKISAETQKSKPVEIIKLIQLQDDAIHPVWYDINQGLTLSKKDKINRYRTICNQLGATENSKIPTKPSDVLRVATYNVHFWLNPYAQWGSKNDDDFKKIAQVIRTINADVLILQEVGGGKQSQEEAFKSLAQEMDYLYSTCCSISSEGTNKPGNLYNCIYSRYPFEEPTISKQFTTNPSKSVTEQNPEQRCFTGGTIILPNKKDITVFSTHLEVRPIIMVDEKGEKIELTPDNARRKQLEELITFINSNKVSENCVIAADFNAFRKEDLTNYTIKNKTLWDILQSDWNNILKSSDLPQNLLHLADKTPTTLTLDYFAQEGYKDSFALSKIKPPQFTTWTGTRIDFMFLKPGWNLPITGCYAFYSWASDHIPVIMDIDLK